MVVDDQREAWPVSALVHSFTLAERLLGRVVVEREPLVTLGDDFAGLAPTRGGSRLPPFRRFTRREILVRMGDEWEVVEGTGWIDVPGFGQINPRRDDVGGGRQYFTATTEDGEVARARGESISGGPETWYFEFDDSFLLADTGEHVVEVSISLLKGGRYAVRYRQGDWPTGQTGGW